MIDTVIQNEIKNKLPAENILNEVYFFPRWEQIGSFTMSENNYFFKKKSINIGLYRKFSSKNMLEKYLIKSQKGDVLANMDLKVYKDSVFIINLNANLSQNHNKLIEYMLQTAVEKALYNTTKKEVVFNIDFKTSGYTKLKKILSSLEFMRENNQNDLEKRMFGETYSIKIKQSSLWMKKIKENPILINK